VVPLVSGETAWAVSGRTAGALAGQAGRLAGHLAAHPGLDPADVGWSLATSRSVFEHRAVVTGSSREELIGGLAAVAAGEPAAGASAGVAGAPGKVVLVFPGQGGQWAGMGRELAACSPVFAARLAQCGRALAPFTDWSLEDALGDARALERVDVVQPALWAVMVSLAAVWEAAGVVPDAVLGHSQGEIAAACAAGALSLEDGAAVVALRSRALRALAGRGAMCSLAEPAARARERIGAWGGDLSVAAVNGPAATVVSGAPAAVAELAAACEAEGVRARVLPVDYASHSAQVEELRAEILAALDGITPGPARAAMVSAATGQWLAGPELGAGYWYESLRAPVEFDRAVRMLAAAGHGTFIEVSPHPVLTTAVAATLEEAGAGAPVAGGTLRRDDGGPGRLLRSLAEVHVRGVSVDWQAVLGGGARVDLPTYAFQHERFWPRPARPAGDVTAAGLGAVGHPLLGAAVELAGGQGLVFTGRLSGRDQPWLPDHAVAGTVLLPGTGFVEMALAAGEQAGCGRLEELTLEAPLVIPPGEAVAVQVMLAAPDEAGRRPVEVHSRPGKHPDTPWARHAAGWLAPEPDGTDGAGAGAGGRGGGGGRRGTGRAGRRLAPGWCRAGARRGGPLRAAGGGGLRVRAVVPRAARRVAARR
jgi:acyl transferase domain-containing protein